MGATEIIQATYRNAGLGPRVTRAAAADPQNVWQTVFTVTGGLVVITSLVGVRTVIQAGGASTMQFRHSIAPTVLDAGGLVITADAVGTIYALTGDPNDNIMSAIGAAVPLFTGKTVALSATYQGIGVIMPAGIIQVRMTAAAGTGSTRYICTYIPLDDGAIVS